MRELIVYWEKGAWRFDQPSLGITQKPFDCGCSEIITEVLRRQGFAYVCLRKFRLRFSARNRLWYSAKWLRSEGEGNWYSCPQLDMEGWICGKLCSFFREVPETIFFDLAEIKH